MRYALLFLVGLLVACSPQVEEHVPGKPAATTAGETVNTDSLLLARATEIVTVLRNEPATALTPFMHPEAGVRFSPYAFIDRAKDIVLTRDAFQKALKNNTVLHWGSYDGSGEPIKLTVWDYVTRFVYTADFLQTKTVRVNEAVGKGNTVNNLQEVYPGCDFVEFHLPASNPNYGGMDWSSLRLVFREDQGTYFLVGIVHDQWTV